MTFRNLLMGAALAWVASLPVVAQAAGNADAGKQKARTCSACHGADGKAAIPTYPNLAGQNAAYLEMSMRAYKSGQRSGGQAATMTAMAKPLSDQDIADLAAYFSGLK